jgi:hypothetical protein
MRWVLVRKYSASISGILRDFPGSGAMGGKRSIAKMTSSIWSSISFTTIALAQTSRWEGSPANAARATFQSILSSLVLNHASPPENAAQL